MCTCAGGLVANGSSTACVDPNSWLLSGKGNGSFSCHSNQVFAGNPINVGTGVKSQVDVDYQSPTGLEYKRAYTSQSSYDTPSQLFLGQGWRTDWNRAIVGSPTVPPQIQPTFLSVYRQGLGWIPDNTVVTAYISRGDGQTITYTRNGTAWQTDADIVGQLSNQFDATGKVSGWTYVTENQDTEQYNAVGQLLSSTDRVGLTTALVYSDGTAGANGGYVLDATGNPTVTVLPAGLLIRITNAHARSLNLGYDVQSRIVKMIDPAGGAYLYAYDANDNLATVTYPDTKARTYLYGEPANVSSTPATGVSYAHSLTGIVDENGNRFATWSYDSTGRAISSEHAVGVEKISLTYNTGTTNITDALGTVRTQTFMNVLGLPRNGGVSQPGGSGCGAASSNQTYDVNGNVASRTDFKGNTICYAYDLARNLETVRLEGVAPGKACPTTLSTYTPSTATGSVERLITTQWNATYRLSTVVAEPLRLTTYTYDTSGNVLTRSVQPTSDATGGAGVAAMASGKPRVWTYNYNSAGQVLTADGPRTDINDLTTYAYDAQNNLDTVTNALNQVTTLGSYDANGRPGMITDANGLITDLYYDARGRLSSRTTGGETTTYTYDGVGNLINVLLPAGAAYTYTYDAAHRLTEIADSLGNHINYTLDAMGNRTLEQTFDGSGNLVHSHSRVFDALNHLYQNIGAINQTTTFAYDADGNLTNITDPLNRQTVHGYDALNRLVSTTDAASGLTQYGYDALDQLVKVTDPKTLVTQYSRDGLGNLNQQTSPDTGITANVVDEAGNVLSRTDAKGQVTTYIYDALNRLTDIAYLPVSGGTIMQTVAYRYDQGTNGIGHLTQLTDSTGITTYSYDPHGRLASEASQLQGITYTTVYTYDAQGRLASIGYPSGRLVSYGFDAMGRINQISTTLNGSTNILASNVSYEPFGGVHSFSFGDGVTPPIQTYTRSRDQDGRIASYTLNGKVMSIGYDVASQISSITDPQYPLIPAGYGYDALSRLTSYTQGAISQGYGYDADGNRSSQLLGSSTSNYSYAAGSNKLTGIQLNGGATQPVLQDANGSTTNDGTRQYSYDLRGRLIQVTTAQGTINYEVNALGLRVHKQVPYLHTDTLYHYDTQGHLIGESAVGSAQFTREYIYLGDMPVAVMQ